MELARAHPLKTAAKDEIIGVASGQIPPSRTVLQRSPQPERPKMLNQADPVTYIRLSSETLNLSDYPDALRLQWKGSMALGDKSSP